AEAEARTMGIAARVTTPSVREALEKIGLPVKERADLRSAVEKKETAAAVEEVPSTPPLLQIYVDGSNPTSTAAGDKIRTALNELKDQRNRDDLRTSKIHY